MNTETIMSMWDSTTRLMGNTPISTMMAATRKSLQHTLTAAQTVQDGLTVTTKRGQKTSEDIMTTAFEHARNMTTIKDPTEAISKSASVGAEIAEMTLNGLAEIAQISNKSASDAQNALVQASLITVNAIREQTLKAATSESMQAAVNAANPVSSLFADLNNQSAEWWKTTWWANTSSPAVSPLTKPTDAQTGSAAPTKRMAAASTHR